MYYRILSIILCLLVVSCKKEKQPYSPVKHINTTIISSTDDTVTINSVPGATYISCGYTSYGVPIPTQMFGTNEYFTAAIRISVSDTCITNPGTYNFICQYIKDYTVGGA